MTSQEQKRDCQHFVDSTSVARRLLWHIYSIGSIRLTEPDFHEPFEKPGAHFFWVQSGKGKLCYESNEFALIKGKRFWIIDMAKPRTYVPETGGHLTIRGFRFGGPDADIWHDVLDTYREAEFYLEDFNTVRRLHKELNQLIRRKPNVWEWRVHLIITQILGKLLHVRNLLSSPPKEVPRPVTRVIHAVEANPDRDWKARELATKANISYSGLRALFRACQNETLHEYIQRTRLDRARLLLTDKQLTIKMVAARLNFSSEFYLSHFFRKHTEMNPLQCRRQLKVF
jgi:AraC-like DNA-binding protein